MRIGELIKAAAAEQLPVVAPGETRDRGRHDRAALGPAARPANHRAQRGHRLDRHAGLGPAVDLDRRDRSLPVRHRAPAPGWRRCTPAASCGSTSTFRHEGILGTVFTGRLVEETTVGPYRGGRPDDHRAGLDHGLRPVRRRSRRSVPGRLHGRRHLGMKAGILLSQGDPRTAAELAAAAEDAGWDGSSPGTASPSARWTRTTRGC